MFAVSQPQLKVWIKSDETNPTAYFSLMPSFLKQIKDKDMLLIYLGDNFIFGIGNSAVPIDLQHVKSICEKQDPSTKLSEQKKLSIKEGKVFII